MTAYDSGLLRALRSFTTSDVLGFTELAESLHFETDLTGYYLRKLQRRGLVEKIDRGQYRITPLGKSVLAHSKRLSGLTIEPRISIMLVVSIEDRYILTKRAIQPFIGKVEWPTAPLASGQSMPAAAHHVAQLRLGLDIQPKLHGFFRRVDAQNEAIFDDKLFAVHKLSLGATYAQQLLANNQIGEIIQSPLGQLEQLPNRAKSLLDILTFTKSTQSYVEHTYELSSIDLY